MTTSATRPGARGRQPADVEPGELARKLDRLFMLVPDGEREHVYEEIASEINAGAGEHVVSATEVGQLRTGGAGIPTAQVLRGLADFFKIPAAYLLGGDVELESQMEAELDDLELMKRHGVQKVAYQIPVLTGDGREAVEDLDLRIAELPEEGRDVIRAVLAGSESVFRLVGREG